jgi:hypothetical protein
VLADDEVLVRERLSLLSEKATWLVTGFKMSADQAWSHAASNVFRRLE